MNIPSYPELQVAWQKLRAELIEKDAEIERLEMKASIMAGELWDARKLITELANLATYPDIFDSKRADILHRAREATQP
jgi:hypothetical protein